MKGSGLLWVVALAGCYNPHAAPGAPCSPMGICPDGLQCVSGICELTAGASNDASAAFDAAPSDTRGDAPSFAIRINIGGPAYAGIDYPGTWSADPGAGGICNGMPFAAPTPAVNGTKDVALFVNQMFTPKLSCTIPNVPAGTYRVTLLFAELRLGGAPCEAPSPPTRIFDISLEGNVVLAGFDMTTAGGGCAATGGPGHAFSKSFTVAVTDGALNIDESATQGAGALNAIELVSQ